MVDQRDLETEDKEAPEQELIIRNNDVYFGEE